MDYYCRVQDRHSIQDTHLCACSGTQAAFGCRAFYKISNSIDFSFLRLTGCDCLLELLRSLQGRQLAALIMCILGPLHTPSPRPPCLCAHIVESHTASRRQIPTPFVSPPCFPGLPKEEQPQFRTLRSWAALPAACLQHVS